MSSSSPKRFEPFPGDNVYFPSPEGQAARDIFTLRRPIQYITSASSGVAVSRVRATRSEPD